MGSHMQLCAKTLLGPHAAHDALSNTDGDVARLLRHPARPLCCPLGHVLSLQQPLLRRTAHRSADPFLGLSSGANLLLPKSHILHSQLPAL